MADVREVEIVVQGTGHPNRRRLDTPVVEDGSINEVRVLSFLEREDDVLEQGKGWNIRLNVHTDSNPPEGGRGEISFMDLGSK